jgi:hypothetical protein
VNSLVYFLADYYPWWGIPTGLILAEVANGYRRRGERKKFIQYLLVSLVFLSLAAAYIVFDGPEKLRPGMERAERTLQNK